MIDVSGPHRIYELSHPLDADTIPAPVSQPFELDLSYPHAPFDSTAPIDDDTILSGTDRVWMGTHTGTHVDAPFHVSRGRSGLTASGMPAPVVARGVLLDLPSHFEESRVDRVIEPADIEACARRQGTPLRPGDAVLFRTGRDILYSDPETFLTGPFGGPGVAAAHHLIEAGVSIVGSDTMPFEAVPSARPLEVHAMLLADHGIQILEMMNLSTLAADGVHEFLFVLAPLRIAGGTGSPVNPLAIV